MSKLKDTDPMPLGKYKGTAMANVPSSYLVWAKENFKDNEYTHDILIYIKHNWDAIQLELKREQDRRNLSKPF